MFVFLLLRGACFFAVWAGRGEGVFFCCLGGRRVSFCLLFGRGAGVFFVVVCAFWMFHFLLFGRAGERAGDGSSLTYRSA